MRVTHGPVAALVGAFLSLVVPATAADTTAFAPLHDGMADDFALLIEDGRADVGSRYPVSRARLTFRRWQDDGTSHELLPDALRLDAFNSVFADMTLVADGSSWSLAAFCSGPGVSVSEESRDLYVAEDFQCQIDDDGGFFALRPIADAAGAIKGFLATFSGGYGEPRVFSGIMFEKESEKTDQELGDPVRASLVLIDRGSANILFAPVK